MSISSGSIHFLRIELKFEYVDVDSSLPPPLHEWYRTLKIIVYTTYIYIYTDRDRDPCQSSAN